MNDYTEMIDDASNDKDYRPFMICVSQKNESGDSGSSSWQGNMAVIKKSVETGISTVQKKIDKKLNQVQTNIQQQSQRDTRIDKESRN